MYLQILHMLLVLQTIFFSDYDYRKCSFLTDIPSYDRFTLSLRSMMEQLRFCVSNLILFRNSVV